MTKTRDLADLGGGFIQAGTGAEQRTVESKLQDVVSVKDFGAVGDGVTDDTAAIQVALDSVSTAGGCVYFPAGIYAIATALEVSSNTTVRGDQGSSTIKPTFTASGSGLINGNNRAKGAAFINKNFYASSITDRAISFVGLNIDYSDRISGTYGQQVGFFMRYVQNVQVSQCQQIYGGNMTGYLYCDGVQTLGCIARECENAPYDQWSSTGSIVVSGNIAKNVTVAPNQMIQVTGDVTDPYTSALLGIGHCSDISITGNVCISEVADGTVAGIILNALDSGASVSQATITGNYVKGTNYPICLDGDIKETVISSNVINGAVTQGILVTAATSSVFPNGGVISNNIVNSAVNGIDIVKGSNFTVTNNRVTSTAGSQGITLRSDSSNCQVSGNTTSGYSLDLVNNGVSNVMVPLQTSIYNNTTLVVNNAAPPGTTWTSVDLSGVTGANRSNVTLRIINATGSISKFAFRENGSSIETTATTLGTGPNICEMQNTEQAYAQVVTDANGVIEWVSSVATGTVSLVVVAASSIE